MQHLKDCFRNALKEDKMSVIQLTFYKAILFDLVEYETGLREGYQNDFKGIFVIHLMEWHQD